MNKFLRYLQNNGQSDAEQKKRSNVIKRLNNLFTENSKNYDNFEFLIKDKERIKTWMLENLSVSTCAYYSISVRKAIDSMSIAQKDKDAAACFYLNIASECQRAS